MLSEEIVTNHAVEPRQVGDQHSKGIGAEIVAAKHKPLGGNPIRRVTDHLIQRSQLGAGIPCQCDPSEISLCFGKCFSLPDCGAIGELHARSATQGSELRCRTSQKHHAALWVINEDRIGLEESAA